jgi:hypothetical protein
VGTRERPLDLNEGQSVDKNAVSRRAVSSAIAWCTVASAVAVSAVLTVAGPTTTAADPPSSGSATFDFTVPKSPVSAVSSVGLQHRPRGDQAHMLTLLSFLTGWAEGWIASGRPDMAVSWERSPQDRPKQSAWMVVQGPAAWGQLTVWESGEVTVEAMSAASGELLISEHLNVSTEKDLLPVIRRFVATCEV